MTDLKEVETAARVNDAIVDLLEDNLEKAKSGEIQSVALVACCSDASSYHSYECTVRPSYILGELEILKRDIMDDYVDLAHDPKRGM